MRLLLALWCVVAFAQDYPAKNVTIIVPYPAGGPTDQLARLLAPRFAEKLGKSFIVENVSGGGTTIGTGRVARAAHRRCPGLPPRACADLPASQTRPGRPG